jgi:hypothetical protein
MKLKDIKLLLSVAILFFVTSCTDLDVDVKSQYTDSNFPTTDADMEAVCGPAYTSFKANYGRWMWLMQTCSSDEGVMVTNAGNWYDKAQYLQLDLHTWNSDNWIMSSIWTDLFSCISKCNQIKSILDEAPDTDSKTKALAQIRTMRALYYFWAMDNYGDVPIIEEFGMDTPDRTARAEAAQWIADELTTVLDDLPTDVDATTYGKPTRYMAEALLAKLYLNWAVYTASDVTQYTPSNTNSHIDDVVSLCDDIIISGKYDLNDDWLTKFKETNGYAIKDFIFAFSYNWSTDDEDLGGGLTHFRFWGYKFMQYTMDLNKKPSGPLRANGDFVDKYNLENDARNDIWRGGTLYYEGTTTPYVYRVAKNSLDAYYSGDDGTTLVDWTVTLTKDLVIRGTGSTYTNNLATLDLGNDELGLAMGYRNVKFYPSPSSTKNWQSNDMPIFRYADVVMMKAEAILRGATATNGQTVASLVNEIRNCAGAPTVTSMTLDELLDERAREFSDEYWRRNDLIRFGKFEDDWGFKSAEYGFSNTDKYRRIFPLYTDVLENNTNWTQNPGYN